MLPPCALHGHPSIGFFLPIFQVVRMDVFFSMWAPREATLGLLIPAAQDCMLLREGGRWDQWSVGNGPLLWSHIRKAGGKLASALMYRLHPCDYSKAFRHSQMMISTGFPYLSWIWLFDLLVHMLHFTHCTICLHYGWVLYIQFIHHLNKNDMGFSLFIQSDKTTSGTLEQDIQQSYALKCKYMSYQTVKEGNLMLCTVYDFDKVIQINVLDLLWKELTQNHKQNWQINTQKWT